jgi:hypothetical protein
LGASASRLFCRIKETNKQQTSTAAVADLDAYQHSSTAAQDSRNKR